MIKKARNTMKYLDDRYVSIYTHKGIDVCTLKVACPKNGDGLGYAIDHAYFKGCEYNLADDAIKAIDKVIKDNMT
jgi:hypothetical protein